MRRMLPLLPLLLCFGGCEQASPDGDPVAAIEAITIDHIDISGNSSEATTVTIAGKADEDPDTQTFAVSFTPGADGIATDPGGGVAWDMHFEIAVTDSAGNPLSEALTVTVE